MAVVAGVGLMAAKAAMVTLIMDNQFRFPSGTRENCGAPPARPGPPGAVFAPGSPTGDNGLCHG